MKVIYFDCFVVLIDDREENIYAAQAEGLHGIVYKDFASLQQELIRFTTD